MSTVVVGTIQSNSTSPPTFNNTNGTEIGTLCRAFVNFNGTGTVAIRAAFNVTSITDNGTGDYTVNFTNALPDASYSLCGSAKYNGIDATAVRYVGVSSAAALSSVMTTSLVRISAAFANGSLQDPDFCSVAIFR